MHMYVIIIKERLSTWGWGIGRTGEMVPKSWREERENEVILL